MLIYSQKILVIWVGLFLTPSMQCLIQLWQSMMVVNLTQLDGLPVSLKSYFGNLNKNLLTFDILRWASVGWPDLGQFSVSHLWLLPLLLPVFSQGLTRCLVFLMNGMLVLIFSKCEGLRWDEEWDLLSWFFSFSLLPSLSLQLWLWKVNEYLKYITWWRFHGFQAHFVSRCHLRIRPEQLQTLSLSSSPSWHKVMLRSGRSSGPKSVSVISVLFSSSFLQLQPCPGLLPNHLWVVSWDLLPC